MNRKLLIAAMMLPYIGILATGGIAALICGLPYIVLFTWALWPEKGTK